VNVAQLHKAVEEARKTFYELDEATTGYGSFDLGEVQSSTRRVCELLASYRSGGLKKGVDTGDFIEASILCKQT